MKTCECGGKWHRHGIVRYCGEPVGVRYRCAVCGETMTGPFVADVVTGKAHLLRNGRRTLMDWRFTGLGVSGQQSAA